MQAVGIKESEAAPVADHYSSVRKPVKQAALRRIPVRPLIEFDQPVVPVEDYRLLFTRRQFFDAGRGKQVEIACLIALNTENFSSDFLNLIERDILSRGQGKGN